MIFALKTSYTLILRKSNCICTVIDGYAIIFDRATYWNERIHLHVTCLVFNDPRSEGWSLHGQVYSTFFCLSSSSIGLQTAFRSILPCCPSIAFLVSLVFLLPV